MASFFYLFKTAFNSWKNDNISVWSAALSYYTIFSISPLILLVISICGILFGKEAIEGHIFNQIDGLVGKNGAALIQNMIAASTKPKTNIIATVVSTVTLLLGAMGVFGQIQQALNSIWQVKQRPNAGIIGLIRQRLLSFSMILVIGFLLAVSLLASAVVAGLSGVLHHILPFSPVIVEIINNVVALIVIVLLFGLLFKFLPDIKIAWKPVWMGAFVTGVLFTIGKFLIGWYIGRSSYSSTYGASASLAIILVWIYYASQIMFFGAEFTKAYAAANRFAVKPSTYAETKPVKVVVKKQKLPKDRKTATLAGYFLAGTLLQLHKFSKKKRK